MIPIKIITHPLTLIFCFLLLLISGEHIGGFYLLYILLGLPHGSIYALLGVAGVTILLFSNYKYKRKYQYLIEPFLNIGGAIFLLLSLFIFFYNDRDKYNYGTFYQVVPVAILIVFTLFSVIFIINNLVKLLKPDNLHRQRHVVN